MVWKPNVRHNRQMNTPIFPVLRQMNLFHRDLGISR
jgi:hypothetical protein